MFEEFGKSPFLLFGAEGEKTFYGILMRNWEGGNDLQADYPLVSYADLYQMASAVSIEHAGGPKINMKYGRKDHHHAAFEGKHQNPTASDLFFVFCFFRKVSNMCEFVFLDVCQAKYGCS